MSEPRSDTATQGSAGPTKYNQRPEPSNFGTDRLQLFMRDSTFSVPARVEAGGPSRSASDRMREYEPIFASVSGMNSQAQNDGTNGSTSNASS